LTIRLASLGSSDDHFSKSLPDGIKSFALQVRTRIFSNSKTQSQKTLDDKPREESIKIFIASCLL
jgi:hypothetical protein